MSDHALAISVKEAAERLGVSPKTAYRQATSGTLPTVRFGSRLLVPTAALERMLEVEAAPDTRGDECGN